MPNLIYNTTDLQAILASVNALPEAGSGGGIVPTGTRQITENGTYDVTNYASAEVNVPSDGGSTDTTNEDAVISGSIEGDYVNDRVTAIASYVFRGRSKLKTVTFAAVQSVGSESFRSCSGMTKADFSTLKSIAGSAFRQTTALAALIIRTATMCTLPATSAFTDSTIESGTGYIYVPRALLSDDDATKDYRRATNWSTYASQFRAIEDYPDITGG